MAVRNTRLGDGFLTMDPGSTGAKEFGEQVTNVELVPSVSKSDRVYVLSGGSVAGDRKETFKIKGKILPDFGETDSIQEWCFTNRGKDLSFEFIPNKEKTRKVTGKLTVEAVNIGGNVRAADQIDFEFDAFDVNLANYTPTPTP